MVTRSVVRVVVPLVTTGYGPEVSVFSPFAAKDALKDAVPSSARRWDANGKCWRIPTWAIPDLVVEMRDYGYSVICTYADGSPWPRPARPQPAATRTTASDWVTGAFSTCTDAGQVERMRGGLLRAHHPDQGAAPRLVAQINTAAEHRRKQLR